MRRKVLKRHIHTLSLIHNVCLDCPAAIHISFASLVAAIACDNSDCFQIDGIE
jgi:hypothetical protein